MALDIPTISYDSIPQARRDEDFFIETITFKVEDTIFRVPRMGFLDPECFFAGMFDLPGPGPNGEQAQGTTDESPIVLEGESKAHFKAFLKALYPALYCSLPETGKPYRASITRKIDVDSYDEWVGVLHLSTKWGFSETRKTAIENISRFTKTDVWDKILLAKKYNVRKWLLEGYKVLVNSRAPQDVDQLVENMGVADALKLLQIREKSLTSLADYLENDSRGFYSPPSRQRLNPETLILESFSYEFASMEDA
ncbi:hypothetical protein CPC08DRAFT_709863 [Agrocybe pediades]|nr:hypothetical protein CPC08DRAFT_709863 [Agrocybe pediades]